MKIIMPAISGAGPAQFGFFFKLLLLKYSQFTMVVLVSGTVLKAK